jgi:hypothetical protein
MELELSTKRKKVGGVIEPVLLEKVIGPTGSIKYLGVILNATPIWKEHV